MCSVVIQAAERAIFETRISSMRPVKYRVALSGLPPQSQLAGEASVVQKVGTFWVENAMGTPFT